MKKFIPALTFIFMFICANAQETPQNFTYSGSIPEVFDSTRMHRIDSAYKRLVDSGIIPHAVTFVAYKGKVIHYKAFGWRNIENKIKCKKTDIFRIASQSKPITVVALMTLFEEGRFLLDEPIKKYIPEFENPKVLDTYNVADTTYTTHSAKRDITIRDLITHTSGITGYTGNFASIYKKAGIPAFVTTDNISLGEVVKKIAKLPLANEPGDRFNYGMSVDVLGYLIEILSGKSIDVFLKERIFDPLGMKDTYFYLPQQKVDRLVTLYEFPKNGKLQPNNDQTFQYFPIKGEKKYYSPGAGLCGTIEDYAKFCQMILNNGEFNNVRILGRKTIEMMKQNGVGNMRGEIGFGMAWDVFTEQYAHKTIASVGSSRWGGMFGTDYLIDPKEQLIVLIYTNLNPNFSNTDPKVLMHNVTYQMLK